MGGEGRGNLHVLPKLTRKWGLIRDWGLIELIQ